MSDFLNSGEDVTNVSARRLAIRALNKADRNEETHGEIMAELGDLKASIDALVELVTKSLSERPPQ